MNYKTLEIVTTVIAVGIVSFIIKTGLQPVEISAQTPKLVGTEPHQASYTVTPATYTAPRTANEITEYSEGHITLADYLETLQQIQIEHEQQQPIHSLSSTKMESQAQAEQHSLRPQTSTMSSPSQAAANNSTNSDTAAASSPGETASPSHSADSSSDHSLPTGGGFAGSSQGYPQVVDENIDQSNPRPTAKLTFSDLPALNNFYSPLAEQNRQALLARLVAAFDQYYANNFPSSRDISEDFRFYYFRQELQAFVDIFHATEDIRYLQTAKGLSLEAIADANRNIKPVYHHSANRGDFPTFNRSGAPSVFSRDGTELWCGQLNDFQGAAGLMLVAITLKEHDVSGWREIADFVETQIVEKWLYWNPSRHQAQYTGNHSKTHLLSMLETARDKREHFADICLQLNGLGYDKYPYRDWAQFLFEIYLTERTSKSEPFPDAQYRRNVPIDWGLIRLTNNTLVWSSGHSNFAVWDTSHANRTVWVAAQGKEHGLVPEATINRLIATLNRNLRNTSKGPFFFNDNIDGSVHQDDPGRRGNLWFGWHRLAAYDANLENLFISLAYDLTNGGTNITPQNAQNRTLPEAPLCLFAWAARLISTE